MRVRGKKLLAAMLSLAMVLSMFVIPAAAAPEEITYPEWTFINDGNATGTDYTTLSFEGLTIAGDVTKHGDQYGLTANGATFTATVPGPCTVTVTVGATWLVWMEEDAAHNDRQSCYDNSNDSNTELVFNYTGEAGTVKIHTSSDTKSSYVLSIKTSAPAGGGEPDPGDETTKTVVKDVYQLSSKGHAGARGSQITAAEKLPDGITFDSSFTYDNDHGPHSGGGGKMTVNIPEGKYSTLMLTVCQHGKGGTVTTSSGTISSGKDPGSNSTDSGLEYTIVNATGTTEISFSAEVYVHGITVGEFTDAPVELGPSLELDKSEVTVKVDDAATKTATVTATVENADGAEVQAVSSDSTIATASVSGNTITITAVAAGNTTVKVSLKDVENSPEKTIAVKVKPAGPENLGPGTYYFCGKYHNGAQPTGSDTIWAYDALTGLSWETIDNKNTDGHGPYSGSGGSMTVSIEAGKYSTLIVTTCAYGSGFPAGGAITATSDGTELTVSTIQTSKHGSEKDYITTIYNAAGTTTISFGSKVYVHGITVGELTTEPVDVAPAVALSLESVEVEEGKTATVTATMSNAPDGAKVKAVSSSEATVAATVGDDGVITITANKEGEATVTVSMVNADDTPVDGATAKTITVTVIKPHTGAVGEKWVFTGTEDITASTESFQGLTLNNTKCEGNTSKPHIILNAAGSTIGVPVAGKCTVVVTGYYSGTGTVGDTPYDFATGNTSTTRDCEYSYTDEAAGTVVIAAANQTYITKIEIKEYSAPKPYLTLDKDMVELKLDGTTSADVNVTVGNRPNGATLKAESKNAAVATAAVNGDTVTITAVGEGETYVDVTLDGVAELKKSIKVFVDPAGEIADIMAEGIIYFDQLRNANFANIILSRIRGLDAPSFKVGNEHGIEGANGSTITIKMKKPGSITVQGCTYSAGKDLVMTSSSGDVEKKIVSANNGESDTALFFVTGASGDTTLTFSGGTAYIHYIMVEYDFDIDDRNFDVWDFSGKAESGENYNNHITAAADYAGHVANGLFTSNGDLTFGDLTINHQLNDRLYSTEAGLSSIANTSGDYTGWYCNGEGKKDTSRCITIAHVAAGDKIVAYIGGHNGDVTYHFQGVGPASEQDDTKVQSSASVPCVFVAQYSGTYKIWGEGGNKPLYQRIERYRGVEVSGSITLPAEFDADEYTVKFINQDNGQVTPATLEGNNFTVTLAPGFKYVASLSGALGWGFNEETRFVTTTNDEILTGKDGVELVVETKALYTYSGTISGFAEGYAFSGDGLKITMVPDKAAVANGAENVELTLTGMAFTAKLDPDNVTYTLEMTGANDYAITAPTQVSSTGADLTGQTISVEAKALQTVSGKFLGLTGDATVTALSFENVDDGYTYSATVTADGYTANLRAGAYAAVATVANHSTKTHVVVTEGKNTVKDLLFVSTAAKPSLAWAADVYVDPAKTGEANTYATIRKAVDAVSRMGVSSEAKRVTIHIAPGTYREQVIINTPYITLTNDKAGEVLVTWYYGIGYKYYSSGDGYYDEELAYDKYEKAIADRWGTAVRVEKTATAFRAEGITFENSFNRYVTPEELADGVEPAGNEKIDLVRTLGMDVSTNAATERAAAMCVEADQSEFFNCTFLSSQDTIYTNAKVYFKNCFIEGQTDYIFGDVNSKCVFDECTLNWKGYSANSKGGYITALRTNEGDVGYLFRDCTIVANPDLTVTPGYFGRPWGPKAGVFFLNTKLEKDNLINPVGWYEMSGNDPAAAQYKEFGTTLNGAAVNTSQRIPGTVATQAQADAVKVTDYFGSWTPYYYGIETRTVTFKVSSGASVTDLAEDGEARVLDSKNKLLALKEAVITFKIGLVEGYTLGGVTGATWDDDGVYTVTADTVVISASSPSSGDMLPTGPVGGSSNTSTVTNPDGSKTTTTTDKKGNTTVTTVAPDGSKVETVTTKAGDKTITVTDAKGEVQVKIELPATIPAPETKFTDVPESHWAEGAINDMAGLGLVKGVSEDTFDTDSPITRASVATILFRLSNGAKGKTSSFNDVPAGEWYADAVAWAASAGVVNGYSETIFAPNESITREQFAVMLYRFAKLIRMDTAASGDVSKFGDAASVSEWAADAMTWCVGKGILNGTNDPVQGIALSPAKTASRAECAVMLGRFIALI